jgi:hypothetical protein
LLLSEQFDIGTRCSVHPRSSISPRRAASRHVLHVQSFSG